MATGGKEQVDYRLVKDETITLTNDNNTPNYISIVICEDNIIVADVNDRSIELYRGADRDRLGLIRGPPVAAICPMDATTICVLSRFGDLMSFQYNNMSSPVYMTHNAAFDKYCSAVIVNDNIIVLVGGQGDWLCWCIVSLDDRNVDTNRQVYRICKMSGESRCSVTTMGTMIYISCYAGPLDTGVYSFDILNPSQTNDKYKHESLKCPTSIVINEDGNIFVGNGGRDSCIHQTTAFSLSVTVAIFTVGIPRKIEHMFWDNRRLYVTCKGSHDITVFRHVNKGSHKASEASHEKKKPDIEELAIQIAQGNVDNGQSIVETETTPSGPSPEDSEDEKQGNHTDLEVPISDERKQPVIEVTSTQIGQEIVDNGQSSVETETTPSGPRPKSSEDEIEDSKVQIRDEGKQLVIEGTSTQIAQEIPIEKSVEEELNQAGIKMSTMERDLFIKFQNEIGTDIYFSKGPHRSRDGQETLNATDTFFAQSCPDMMDKWLEYKSQGKLTPELIDVIYADKRNKELHEKKDDFLNKMEQLNIIVKARAFNENGVKEENYFFTPCMLQKESPREVIAPDKDARMVSTSVLCWVNTRTFKLSIIFQKLIAACLARWPVAKKKNTTESLIFQNCTVFDLDPVHRLFLHCENHAVLARIAIMGIDHVNAKMCTRVRKFIALNLSEITLHQDPNIKYRLCIQNIESQDIPENTGSRYSPPIEMWLVDEVHDPAAPITREHMNHARLCVAIIAICGKAMRTILGDNPSAPHATINHAILANKTKLISKTKNGSGKWQNALLYKDQSNIVFPDPTSQDVASIDQFDISLLYILIRHISSVRPPSTDWGVAPHDYPRDQSLGANVERIRLYRNEICGHTVDGQISQPKFDDYWKKIHSVLNDIDAIVGQTFIQELEMQRKQVISVYEAC